MRVVVTGAAGFLGSHLSEALLAEGHDVVGIDCFTAYYARADKERNLAPALAHPAFTFHEADLRSDDLRPLVAGADGSIELLVQADPPPPERRANWLPVKAGQDFVLNARLYRPRAQALDGRWSMPPVERLE